MKDLVILVADKDMEFSLYGILQRYFYDRKIKYKIYPHNLHDPGVYKQAADFLRPLQKEYRYALVVFDKEGSGQEKRSTEQIYDEIKEKLAINGWNERSEVIIIEPELEIWAWINSIHIAEALGWTTYSELAKFIRDKKLWPENMNKPLRPKEAFELALREKRIPRSPSIYKKIADKVNFTRCEDRALKKLLSIFQEWFEI